MLSILIPAHNEEMFIEETLQRVVAFSLGCEKEIIVINDGSTDNTGEVLRRLKNDFDFKLIEYKNNKGKGSAIKSGLDLVTGDLAIIQDADLEYNPAEIPKLLNAMSADVALVCGQRSSKVWPERGRHYVLGAKALTTFINILYGAKLRDAYTGYKLFNLKNVDINFLKNLESSGFEFEAEVLCKIFKNSGKVVEVPINYKPRSKKEGKKISFMDAVKGAIMTVKTKLKS